MKIGGILLSFTWVALVNAAHRKSEPYVIGGVPVSPREFPEMVSIQLDGIHRCGGSILNSEWIMTIAHCMGNGISHYAVVSGSDDLEIDQGTKHGIEKIIIHEFYNRGDSWKNDIALIKVNPPITLGDVNKAAVLPPQGQSPMEGDKATVIGYGSTKLGGQPTHKLRKAKITVSNHDQCKKVYSSQFNMDVHDTQLCAGENGGKGFCGYDSGGPLFVDGNVVGISSWTYKCAEPSYPSVFTDVSKFIVWINEILNNSS